MVETSDLAGGTMRRAIAAATVLICLLVTASPTASQNESPQQPGATPQPTRQWQVSCRSRAREIPPDCVVAQGIAVSARATIKFNVRVPGEARKPLMVIQTPLGSLLTAGITVDVDGANPIRLEYRNCDVNGCYAIAPVSDELLEAMFRGQKLNLTIQTLNGQPAKGTIDLNGFTVAYRSVR